MAFNNQRLAHCLALLPKSRGDEESWSLMMQKILLLINGHLNDAFQGLEEGTVEEILVVLVLVLSIVSDNFHVLQKLNGMKLLDYWFRQEKIPHRP